MSVNLELADMGEATNLTEIWNIQSHSIIEKYDKCS